MVLQYFHALRFWWRSYYPARISHARSKLPELDGGEAYRSPLLLRRKKHGFLEIFLKRIH